MPDELSVYADASLLRRVLQNLIANAIKYTPRGEIVIGARDLGVGNGVECTVSDNGSGIPAELLEKVFEKGETDSDSDGGTGLGLAIVKTFIEAHGGRVSVESEKGAGTTFRFSLPGAAQRARTCDDLPWPARSGVSDDTPEPAHGSSQSICGGRH